MGGGGDLVLAQGGAEEEGAEAAAASEECAMGTRGGAAGGESLSITKASHRRKLAEPIGGRIALKAMLERLPTSREKSWSSRIRAVGSSGEWRLSIGITRLPSMMRAGFVGSRSIHRSGAAAATERDACSPSK